MLSRQVLVRAFVAAVLTAGSPTARIAQGGEKKVAPVPPEQVKAALKGFRGFLVGETTGKTETGIVLRIQSMTLLKGCKAANPALAIGQAVPVLYDTVVANEGDEAPNGRLLKSIARIETIPPFAFDGFHGEMAAGKLVLDWGEEGGVRWATHMLWLGKKERNEDVRRQAEAIRMDLQADEKLRKELQDGKLTDEQIAKVQGAMVRVISAMRRRGENIEMDRRVRMYFEKEVGLTAEQIDVVIGVSKQMAERDVPAEQAAKPRGPIVTARVFTDGAGDLVMDRILPGAHPAATWEGMDKLEFHFGDKGKAQGKDGGRPAAPPKKGADF
jgi:hypothetical protein